MGKTFLADTGIFAGRGKRVRDLEAAARHLCAGTRTAVDEQETLELIESDAIFSLVVIDLDTIESGVWLALGAVERLPAPIVIVVHSGDVDPDDAFRLGERGVRRFLRWPLQPWELVDEIRATRPPPMVRVVAPFVGHTALYEFERRARRAFVEHAIALVGGNRTYAAELLGVPRMILQRVLLPKGRQGKAGRPRRE